MQKQLLRCGFVFFTLLVITVGLTARAATNFVAPIQIGSFPNQKFYWKPTNVVIAVGDTVMWTNLGNIHSVNPTNTAEVFCGTGTNNIQSCTVKFLSSGTFSYNCWDHRVSMTGEVIVVAVPPVVTITNPADNSIFAAPAIVTVSASATNAGNSVTNVQFLSNGVAIAAATAPPYRLTLSNLISGNYTLSARAMNDFALVTTSAPVTIRVAPPPNLIANRWTNGPLQFTFNTATNASYVIDAGLTVTSLTPISTNAGTGIPQTYFQSNPPPVQRFFRLRLQ